MGVPLNSSYGNSINTRLSDLAALATNRQRLLFSEDIERFTPELKNQITGRRILVIGGAGSIGGATVRALVPFKPASLHVVDQNENTLVEVVRDLRSRFDAADLPDFRTLPLNFGSPIMQRFIQTEASYDYVLNFAALKHVRSEKDCYSILQMLETNVMKPAALLNWLASRGGVRGYFCVSTDKAANPVNLMGASKRLMEHMIFSREIVDSPAMKVASARFANVAFSDGSLLQGWLMRLSQGQPLAAPKNTRRYFVSIEESGQICLLAAFLAPDRHLLVPRLNPSNDLLDLSQIAVKVLRRFGYEPEFFEDEVAARRAAESLKSNGRYPLLLTPLDTSGEKAYEEFVGAGEQSVEVGMREALGVSYVPSPPGLLPAFVKRMDRMINSPDGVTSKDDLVKEIQRLLPEFQHRSSSKILDQRL